MDEVFAISVSGTGYRKVELAGGWVPFDGLKPVRKIQIGKVVSDQMSNTDDLNSWEMGRGPLHVEFAKKEMDSERYDDDDLNERRAAETDDDDVSQGNNDSDEDEDESESESESESGSGSESESGGEGDDDPFVKQSEFKPYKKKAAVELDKVRAVSVETAAQVKDVLGKVADLDEKLEVARADTTLLLDVQAGVNRKLDLIDKKIKEARLEGGGGKGGSGGVIVRIEFTKPGEPMVPRDGVFHEKFPTLLKLAMAGQHVYLPGPPGAGKSHAAEAAAAALGWRFGAISLGPTTPESRLWGGMDANGSFHQTSLTEGMIHAEENPDSGLAYCLDEMDNGHPGIIATLNSSMANGWVLLPNGRKVQFGSNVVFIGCANTFGTGPTAEFSGRNRLDAATLDRFRYLPWDTDLGMEATMVNSFLHETPDLAKDWLDVWHSCRKNVEANGLKIFVTMRGAIAGAKMLACGFDLFDTLDMVLLNKLPSDQAKKVNPL